MLVELSIENLGVLPSATASWAPGLTVLTGETGAGKTFLLSGLKLIQGARADSSRVREGQSKHSSKGSLTFQRSTKLTVLPSRMKLKTSAGIPKTTKSSCPDQSRRKVDHVPTSADGPSLQDDWQLWWIIC